MIGSRHQEEEPRCKDAPTERQSSLNGRVAAVGENVRLTHNVYIIFFYMLKGNWRLGATAFGLLSFFFFLIGPALGQGMGK